MGIFSKVTTASVNGGGVYFQAGNYKVKILAVKSILSRMNENMFVVETEIIESDVAALRPGTKCSQVINLSKHDSAPGNIKAFMCAALDVKPDEITEDEVELAVSEENPLEGTIMGLVCTTTKTKRGTDFTLHQWRFIEEPEGGRAGRSSRSVAAAAPPPPPAGPKLLPGYQVHPTSPTHQWNPQTNDVRVI